MKLEQKKKALIECAQKERDKDIERSRSRLSETIRECRATFSVKTDLIKAVTTEKELSYIEGMFGDDTILIRATDFKVAHFISKALHIKLKRTVESDGLNYRGTVITGTSRVSIDIFGVINPPGCELKKIVTMVPKTQYKIVCDGEEEKA